MDPKELHAALWVLCPEAIYITAQEVCDGYRDQPPAMKYRAMVDFGPGVEAITVSHAETVDQLKSEVTRLMADLRAKWTAATLLEQGTAALRNLQGSPLPAGGGDVVLGADGQPLPDGTIADELNRADEQVAPGVGSPDGPVLRLPDGQRRKRS